MHAVSQQRATRPRQKPLEADKAGLDGKKDKNSKGNSKGQAATKGKQIEVEQASPREEAKPPADEKDLLQTPKAKQQGDA